MNTEKSLAAVLTETKEEIRDFIETRLQLLHSEIKEKITTWKYSVPLLLMAGGLLLIGWLALTFTFVALLRTVFLPSPYAWAWGSLIIAVIYLVSGLVIGWFAYNEFKAVGLAPRRTLEVLKQDRVWIRNEGRTV